MRYFAVILLALALGGCEQAERLSAPELPRYDIVVGLVEVVEHPSGHYVTTVQTEDGQTIWIQLAEGERASLGWNRTRQVFTGNLGGRDAPVLNNARFVEPIDYELLGESAHECNGCCQVAI